MTSRRACLWLVPVAATALGGCGLMGYFEEEPERGCEPGTTRVVPEERCGVCDAGTVNEICGEDRRWTFDFCANDYIDGDRDGIPNVRCGDLEGGCCTTELDCNDGDSETGAGECTYGDPVSGTQQEECELPCGSRSVRRCTEACVWDECEVPERDGCDGVDDDCDGTTDEDTECVPGATVTCHTTCDPIGVETGSGLCTDACLVPTGLDCEPPAEICDGRDNDCDTIAENGFACVRGTSMSCNTTCGSVGTGFCTSECQAPAPADCTPPAESCNALDDDCDTAADDGFSCVEGDVVDCTTTCGTTGTGICTADTCEIPTGEACIPPSEWCGDLVDNDCDTRTDEPDPEQCTPGETVECRTTCDGLADHTGTGVCTTFCVPPRPEDCTPPEETCTGRDDDCDTLADEGFDCRAGATGVPCTTTCGGALGTGTCTASCEIPAPEACAPPDEVCNGVDDDCDTVADNSFYCRSGATEVCSTSCGSSGLRTCSATCVWGDCVPPAESCNAADDDCDGTTDEDFACIQGRAVSCLTNCGSVGSGTCTASCDIPGVGSCTPPVEACNALDDDCDGLTDEIYSCIQGRTVPCTTTCDTTGSGVCTAACEVPTGEACTPPAEICDAIDQDCDGQTDETFTCITGRTVPCTTSCGTTGSGVCTATCAIPGPGACTPPVESCNALDDDCDGLTDETFACIQGRTVSCATTCGSTGSGTCTSTCAIPTGGACTPPAESCNALDDDCDGLTDETYACVQGRTVPCTTTCGSTGNGTCTASCAIPTGPECTAPSEVCNGVDDDCVAGCDNGFACCAGSTVACTTSCGTVGSGTCTAACAIPGPASCAPPTESCNAVDDDCDGLTDETFACIQGHTVPCTTTCGTTGSGACTSACAIPPPASCTVPAEACNGIDDDCDTLTDEGFAAPTVPRPSWPENGARTGSHLATRSLRPTFRWQPATAGACGAVTYELQVDESCTTPGFASCGFFAPLAVHVTDLTGTSYTPTSSLAVETASRPYGRRYYWRVRACDAYGHCGAWSAVRYLDVGRAPNDFNGDGYSDWLIGAPREDNIPGVIRLYLGSASPDTTADLSAEGPLGGGGTGDLLGEASAGAGDVNADGYADFVVGAKNAPLASPGQGRAYLFLGGATPDLVADVTYAAIDPTGEAFGDSVAGAGDANADGYADVLVGAPGYSTFTGRAFLFLGAASPSGSANAEFRGEVSNSRFGWAVAGAGDVNVDGRADLLVGAYTFSGSYGRSYVFYGAATYNPTPPIATADWVVSGSTVSRLGQGVGRIGDFNGDGVGDLAIGAPGISQVSVYYGGTTFDTTADVSLSGDQSFGYVVCGAGDVDADGFNDLIVGAPEYGAPTSYGAAYLFRGASSPSTTYRVLVSGTSALDRMGYAVGAAGDVDGDGYADAVAGAVCNTTGCLGSATVFRGNAAADWTSRVVTTGAYPEGQYGYSVGGAP